MDRHSATAMRIAQDLEAGPQVGRVYYPGLDSHPQRALAERQMDAFGGAWSPWSSEAACRRGSRSWTPCTSRPAR
ncbi:PLP-dependent transferase [Salana multivorans]